MRSRFGWMLRLTSPRAHLNSFCAHERRIGETPTRNELAWKGNKRWLESIQTYVYMRRQARAIDEYISCAISWRKKTWPKVDPIRPALCVAWDQLQTMLVCPPEYVNLYIKKTFPPHQLSPHRKALPVCKSPLPRRMQMLRGWPRMRSLPNLQGPFRVLG